MKPIRTVAVVEDDDDDFFFTQRALRRHSEAMILRLPHGLAAIDYLAGAGAYADRTQFPLPDVMLVDLKMEPGTGLDVLAAVREHPVQPSPRIFVLTGSDEARDRDRVRSSGVAVGYLVKPLSGDNVLAILGPPTSPSVLR